MSDAPKSKRVTLSTVKKRGWTDAMVREVLGDPDATAPNPHYRSVGAPMRLYYLDRVIAAESTEEFTAAKTKAERRRKSSRKGLQAARAVREAEAAMRAEADRAAYEIQTENWADKHAWAALDTSRPIGMRDRRDYRSIANEMYEELEFRMCQSCKWRHREESGCLPTIQSAHAEAMLRAEVESIFEMPPDPISGTPTPIEERWNPKKDKSRISKSEVGRRTGWSGHQIDRILGQPDEIIIESHRHVKLYSVDRVESAREGLRKH